MFMRKTLSLLATTAIVLSVAAFSPTDERTATGRMTDQAETMAPAPAVATETPTLMETTAPTAPPVYVPPTNEITVTTPAANPPEMGAVTIPAATAMTTSADVAPSVHPSSDDWKNHIYTPPKKAKPAKKRKPKKKVEVAPVVAPTAAETTAPSTAGGTASATATDTAVPASPSLTTAPTAASEPTMTEPTAVEPMTTDTMATEPMATDMGTAPAQNDLPQLTTEPSTTP
jgi:hypothetical protein